MAENTDNTFLFFQELKELSIWLSDWSKRVPYNTGEFIKYRAKILRTFDNINRLVNWLLLNNQSDMGRKVEKEFEQLQVYCLPDVPDGDAITVNSILIAQSCGFALSKTIGDMAEFEEHRTQAMKTESKPIEIKPVEDRPITLTDFLKKHCGLTDIRRIINFKDKLMKAAKPGKNGKPAKILLPEPLNKDERESGQAFFYRESELLKLWPIYHTKTTLPPISSEKSEEE